MNLWPVIEILINQREKAIPMKRRRWRERRRRKEKEKKEKKTL